MVQKLTKLEFTRLYHEPCWLTALKLGLYANEMKAEMKFMRTAGYTHLGYERNLNTMKELNK
jgi:hypothetical protein